MFNVWFKELHLVFKSTLVWDGKYENSHNVCKLYIKIECKIWWNDLIKAKSIWLNVSPQGCELWTWRIQTVNTKLNNLLNKENWKLDDITTGFTSFLLEWSEEICT